MAFSRILNSVIPKVGFNHRERRSMAALATNQDTASLLDLNGDHLHRPSDTEDGKGEVRSLIRGKTRLRAGQRPELAALVRDRQFFGLLLVGCQRESELPLDDITAQDGIDV
jgi:hypothetical protein